jgi:hypothetical protein
MIGDDHVENVNYGGVVFAYDTQLLVSGVGGENRVIADVDPQETVNVVWRAESGGKTQTLFKYTTQSASGQDA